MKNYNTFLTELVHNVKNLKWFSRILLYDIRNLDEKSFHFINRLNKDNRDEYEMIITTNKKVEKETDKLVQKYQREMLKTDTYVYYTKTYDRELDYKDDLSFTVKEDGEIYVRYYIYIKNVHIKRVKPSHFVYHTSDIKHRESIQEKGLLPHENINYKHSVSLNHPAMIFATLDKPMWHYKSTDMDIWEIDTTKIPNKWWQDPNMINNYDGDKCIMTFEPIQPSSIKLRNDLRND